MNIEQFKDLTEKIVEYSLKRGADDAIVNSYRTDTRQIRFSENSIDIFNRWDETYFHLFLSMKRKVVSTTIKAADNFRRIVDGAIRTAEASQPSEDYRGIAEKTNARSHASKWKPVSDRVLADYVAEAIQASADNGAHRATGTLYNEHADHYLSTSNDIRKFENGSSFYMSIRCFADEDASGHSVISSTSEKTFFPEKAAEKAAGLARQVRKPAGGLEGRFDSILDPMVVATITSEVGSMSSAFNVLAGFSCFEGKVGKQVGSRQVTIEDDATRDLNGKRYFDDEGAAVRRTRIVSEGILKGYLHNTSTARKFRTRTTGNAGLIEPEAMSLSMKGGSESFETMLGDMKDGLYINNVWYTRYQNSKLGNFSTIPRDAILRVRRGEVVGSVRDIRITENLVNLLKKIKSVSREREHINWWLESYTPSTVPYALVGRLNITRSADKGS